MAVKVKVRPTGLINGQEWPEVGESVDHLNLPDDVVDGMVKAGFLEKSKGGGGKVETRPAVDESEKRTAKKSAPKKS